MSDKLERVSNQLKENVGSYGKLESALRDLRKSIAKIDKLIQQRGEPSFKDFSDEVMKDVDTQTEERKLKTLDMDSEELVKPICWIHPPGDCIATALHSQFSVLGFGQHGQIFLTQNIQDANDFQYKEEVQSDSSIDVEVPNKHKIPKVSQNIN